MIASKKLSLALVMLSMVSATGYAAVKKPAQKPGNPTVFMIMNKHEAKKRHVSMLRAWWNNIKFGFGGTVFSAGIVLVPVTVGTAAGLLQGDAVPVKIHPAAAIVGLALSPTFTYFGWKIMRNSFDSMRDEYVESYFGITHPNQMQYRGETEETAPAA